MATERVADLTMEELRDMIRREVDQRLRVWPRPYDPRSAREILDSIKRNRWTPPPGSPSTLELLREDRDR
jgi:hypothetical protein